MPGEPDRRSQRQRQGRQAALPFARVGESVEGVFSIDLVTFVSPETGYAVVRIVPADDPDAAGFTAVGLIGDVHSGECYRIQGVWRSDPQYGLQVAISSALREAPTSLPAIERYLAGASIKGLGPHYASVLVEHFGDKTFEVLETGGQALEEVSGIGPVRAQTIRDSWAEHEGIHKLMVNLQGVAQLSPSQAQRVYQHYGHDAWPKISQDPYQLAEDVRGFGFKTCDRIGKALGIAHDAPERIRAGVIHLLTIGLNEGHLWCSQQQAVEDGSELLHVDAPVIGPQIDALAEKGRIALEEIDIQGVLTSAVSLPRVSDTEARIAQRLAYVMGLSPTHPLDLSHERAQQFVTTFGDENLTEEQGLCVVHVLTGARVAILTGGPGTGKTTTVRLLISCLEKLGASYALCATTGRASKQLALAAGRPAATVHRHLRIGFGANRIESVREQVLIIDESSMIDLWLMDQILARLTDDSHLVLVGDVDQLPSVGPGAILQDLIETADSDQIPGLRVVRLSRVFRQEAGDRSLIVVNCHRVRRGMRPTPPTSTDTDYFEMLRATPSEARDLAVGLASRRLPEHLGVPPHEVQVLAPMHRGDAGIRVLNQALQATLNPPSPGRPEIAQMGTGGSTGQRRILRVGDKVRQTRNNYKKQVFNGDLGLIASIDRDAKMLSVSYDGLLAAYAFDELDELVHAWAMTVHAAQGSQWPAVVTIMLTNHYVMLERNILYTALSRAQRVAVLITQERALRIAVSQDRSTRRRTNLENRLLALAGVPL